MTKQEILDTFADINFVYNDSSRYDTLSNMLDELLKEQDKEIKALRVLVAWATQFDFGYNKFGDAYELYKNEIKGMEYIDGMVHIAKRVLEDYGTFKKWR